MMNDFLKIELSSKNEFRTVASFELNGLSFTNVDVKIDTGCPRTSFPVLKLGISDEDAYRMKEKDCSDESVQKRISFGVNDSKLKREEDKKKFKARRFMELNSISFKHTALNFALGGVSIGNFPVSVSYDRTGNILIGMDILKNLEIHIGESSEGKTFLLASPLKHHSETYLAELEKLFIFHSYNV